MTLPFKIETTYAGIKIIGEFKHKLCCFGGNSGNGKSFLRVILSEYCDFNNIPCASIDYTRRKDSTQNILDTCKGKDIVMLDNVELYDVNTIVSELIKTVSLIIVNHQEPIITYGMGNRYEVQFNESTINFYCIGSDAKQ